MRVAVVANPVRDPAGRVDAAVEAACRSRGWPAPRIRATTIEDPGAGQAAAAVRDGSDLVVVSGGDGTVREAASALAGTGVAMGIVPRGTANLYARNLRLPLGSVERSLDVALDGEPHEADLGRARWGRRDGQVREGAFVVLAGIGHDARTVELVRPALKKHTQWVAYFIPALATLGASLLPMTISRDGGPPEQRKLWCLLAGNVGRIPLGIEVLPGARVDDGLLHLAAVAPARVVGWVPIALKGLLHWPRDVAGLGYRTATSVRVDTEAPLTIHVDGDEHSGVVWLEAMIESRVLRVHVPTNGGR
ncbi:MAG TPA: diacylglycerol kinase family protein [Intrasporangium sp.]|uniref:diacylglycerol/lipid kinase family protein n=1 Tax=Intrasporangium sp. TaxID=1925024 RepID=UPI002B47EE17|nr:diacylglycerol kinase family protein [Intrasporangium sp.]HKX66892.1 diacylglycerol kinase family protein [Intrasporangium sp.]